MKARSVLAVLLSLPLLFVFLAASSFKTPAAGTKPVVLVSLPPYAYLAKALAGDLADIRLLLPPGSDPHSYELSTHQALSCQEAKLWFHTREDFERTLLIALQAHNPELTLVDCLQILEGQHHHTHNCSHHHHHHDHDHHHHHHDDAIDPHLWLSPRLMMQEAELMAQSLIQLFPADKDLIESRLAQLKTDLEALDKELSALFEPLADQTLFFVHPAFDYFCEDYKLNSLSIEMEGKDPSESYLCELSQKVAALGVRILFVEPGASQKIATVFAEHANCQVITINPLSEDYIANMRQMAELFAKALQSGS